MDSDEEKSLQLAALQNAASMVAARRRAEAERDRARADAEAARAELEALNQVGITLASELDLERVVQTVTDAATKLTGAQFGASSTTSSTSRAKSSRSTRCPGLRARRSRILDIRGRHPSSRRRFTERRSCAAMTSQRIHATVRWDRTTASRPVIFRCTVTSRCQWRRGRAT